MRRNLFDGLLDSVRRTWLPRVRLSLARSRDIAASHGARFATALWPSIRRVLAAMQEAIGILLIYLADVLVPSVRRSVAATREAIGILADRLVEVVAPRIRRSPAPLGAFVAFLAADLVDRVRGIRLPHGRTIREAPPVADDMPNRLAVLRWRLRTSRLGRSADGIIVLPLLGAVLVLGVFTATAATRGSSSPDTGSNLAAAITTGDLSGDVSSGSGEVVTETITRKGKTVRVVRYRTKPGRVVLETVSGRSVTLPGNSVTVPGASVTSPGHTKTVVETETETRTRTVTDTVTTQEIVTVTETQPGTTVVVTTTVPEGG
jgi:hypothetical protein